MNRKTALLIALFAVTVVEAQAAPAGGKVSFDKLAYEKREKGTLTITANKGCVIKRIWVNATGLKFTPDLATHIGKTSGTSEVEFKVISDRPKNKSVTVVFKGDANHSSEEDIEVTASTTVAKFTFAIVGVSYELVGAYMVSVFAHGKAKPSPGVVNFKGKGENFFSDIRGRINSVDDKYVGTAEKSYQLRKGKDSYGFITATAEYMGIPKKAIGEYSEKMKPPKGFKL